MQCCEQKSNPKCELHIGDVKLIEVQKFNYLESLIIDDRKCNKINRDQKNNIKIIPMEAGEFCHR